MTKKKDVLATISPDEARAVLNRLTRDPQIRKRAEEIALELVADVDADAVADDVFFELDSIAVEDVWVNSGSTRDGCVDPGEYAWQLFENALEPFEEQLRKCRALLLGKQAKLYCIGILKGIWRFESESRSEFKDWAGDAAGETVRSVFEEWKKGSHNRKDIQEVKKFVDSFDRGKTA